MTGEKKKLECKIKSDIFYKYFDEIKPSIVEHCDIVKLVPSEKSINQNKILKNYCVKDFTDELLNELNRHPEEMYMLNPKRVLRVHTGFTLKDLSRLWGHHDSYVSERLLYHNNNPKYILPDKNLKELIIKLKNKFGNEANNCYTLIKSHRNGHFSLDLLIKKLQKEIGKFSQEVKTTLKELALIFSFGYGMMTYIRNNKDYLLSKRRLSIIRNNLEFILEIRQKTL